MSKNDAPTVCYISSHQNPSIDPWLDREGLTHGMLSFAIPSLGILFKCRAEGDPLTLEFGAFFSLLKFIKSSIKQQQPTNIRVHSSNPEFVFAFTGKSPHLTSGSTREKLLREYAKGLQVSVAYVEPYRNQTRVPPDSYPSLSPEDAAILEPDFSDMKKTSFKPFQRGISF